MITSHQSAQQVVTPAHECPCPCLHRRTVHSPVGSAWWQALAEPRDEIWLHGSWSYERAMQSCAALSNPSPEDIASTEIWINLRKDHWKWSWKLSMKTKEFLIIVPSTFWRSVLIQYHQLCRSHLQLPQGTSAKKLLHQISWTCMTN